MKKGITLISLVITIIIMLILAGVGISGSLALIEQAKYAAFANEMKQADEAVYLVIMEGQLEGKTTEEILADIGERIPEEVLKKISNNLKLEILYARDGFPANKLPIPEDYTQELANFSSEENLNSLFLVNASVAGKEQAYIYDEQSASVYKVEPTIIWGVEMHGYDYGNLLVSRPGLLEKAQGKKEEEDENEITSGLISDTTYKINNETLTFSKIAVVGENEELKTVKEGLDYLLDSGYKENGAILLRAGTHDTENIHTGPSGAMDSKYSEMSVSIIADSPGNTFMTAGEMGMAHNGSSYWIEIKFYRIIFTEPVYSDVDSDGFSLNFDSKAKEYYNCVFIPPVGGVNAYVTDTIANVYNCTFIGGNNSWYSRYPLNGLAENCASTTTAMDPINGTKTTCLTTVTLDENYNIISDGWENTGTGTNPDGRQAHIGVYGGKYAWDNVEINIDSTNKEININTANAFEGIKEIKYIYGTRDVNELKNSGEILSLSNKTAKITNIENGLYLFIFTTNSNREIIRTITVEGLDAVSSYKINNETLEFKRIVTIGENAEYKTVKEGLDYLLDNGYKENGAILLRAGTHDTGDIYKNYAINPKYTEMSVSIIADSPGNTFMTSGEMGMAHNGSSYWIEMKFYRIIFTTPVYSDAGTDGFSLNFDSKAKEYYNCVFVPPVGGANAYVTDSKVNVYNCTFMGGNNQWYAAYPLNGLAENCASTTTAIDPVNGTKTTCLTNVTCDENYNITSEGWENTGTGTNPDGSQAHIGVYGGKYAW